MVRLRFKALKNELSFSYVILSHLTMQLTLSNNEPTTTSLIKLVCLSRSCHLSHCFRRVLFSKQCSCEPSGPINSLHILQAWICHEVIATWQWDNNHLFWQLCISHCWNHFEKWHSFQAVLIIISSWQNPLVCVPTICGVLRPGSLTIESHQI